MRIIDIHEVQANLELLIDELRPEESFLISVDGTARVKVTALTDQEIERLSKDES